MKGFTGVASLLAATVVAMGLGGAGAYAQDRGPQVAVKDMDPVIKDAAEVMGLIRGRALTLGQINLPEFDATGTMVDLEAATPGQPVQLSRYNYAVAITIPAAREQFQGPNTPATIRVVKGSRAWNEAWNDKKTKLSTTPADDKLATFRAQMIWLEPHAWMEAAALASNKRGLDGKPGNIAFKVAQENGKTTVEVPVNGVVYKATMGADKRPEAIEAMITLPSGAKKKMVARFTDWRAGEKPDAGYSPAMGKNALDKFHNGTYWPSRIVHELDGQTVMDITLTAGWGNPYVVFPEPELLAKAQ